jgi:hypothetical protein
LILKLNKLFQFIIKSSFLQNVTFQVIFLI